MKIKIKHTMAAILATTAAAFSIPVPAQQQQRAVQTAQKTQESMDHSAHQAPTVHEASHGAINSHPEWVRAVVRRADEDLGKLTLQHDPIPSLGMPAMTMVFRVTDKAWLKGLHAGTPVQVQIQKPSSYFVVTALKTSVATENISPGLDPKKN